MDDFYQTLKIGVGFLGSFNVPLKKFTEKRKHLLNYLHYSLLIVQERTETNRG